MDRQHNRRRVVRISLLLALLCPCAALAQIAPQGDPSPFAPGDLKQPIFDTARPVIDTSREQEKSAASIVAEVDGRAITLGEVSDAIAALPPGMKSASFADLYPSVLDRLVRQQALVIRAQQQALDEDPAVRRKLKEASDQVLADEMLNRAIMPSITEQALLDRYNKDVAGKPGPDEVHLRIIMTTTEEAARGLIAALNAGADFADLAKRSSTDSTASVGGDLGFMRMDALNAEVGSVAFVLPTGQFTPYPFRSAGGWFIVKVEERRRGKTPSYADVRSILEQVMLREGVAEATARAMKGVTVREFDINGKEETGNVPK